MFTKEKINNLADLLLIGLTDDECQMVLDEFNEIDKCINLINEIEEIGDVMPMTHALDNFSCSMREDTIEESIDIDDALKNCDRTLDTEVEVPKVVE